LRLFGDICDIFDIFASFVIYLRVFKYICDFPDLFATGLPAGRQPNLKQTPTQQTKKTPAPKGWCLPQKELLLQVIKRFQSIIYSQIAKLVFDAEKLVVFRDAVSTAHRTSFDLACVCCNSDVSDCGIFCFT
jgi:hypothetical protein